MKFDWELKEAAFKVINDMCNLKKGEYLLIYGDTSVDEDVLFALAEAGHVLGGEVGVYLYRTREEVGLEPPPPLREAMKASDVIIELAEKYLIHTKAYHDALEAGSRNLCLTGMDKEMLKRCVGKIPYRKMVEFGDALMNLLSKKNQMRITTPGGTDLISEIGGRSFFHNSGIIKSPGEQSFLGGQISWAPIEESINGTMVFDGAVWPPDELGLLHEPIVMKVERGRVISIEGGKEAIIFKKWLESFNDPNMFMIAHFSYGFNPGARLTGKILEDERIFGGIEIGLGSQRPRFNGKVGRAKAHTDGIMLNPTVEVDGEIIEKDGEFLHPELKKFNLKEA